MTQVNNQLVNVNKDDKFSTQQISNTKDPLLSFLNWMHKEDLIDTNNITEDSSGGFKSRFRIQKCMFIAQHLGLEKKYEYKRYLRGPYSAQLANDYYDLANISISQDDDNLNSEFKRSECLKIMNRYDKDDDNNAWLEIATTLIHTATKKTDQNKLVSFATTFIRTNKKTDKNKLIDFVSTVKIQYSQSYIERVLGEVLQTPLVRCFNFK